ncbi:hypothetical protein [Nisaea nitritireducens]|uniref:hypothetical protein n=1 Tax=Nisaea nitritireducens TaxID=568392 RepID=UPI001866E9B8|nr:hypothetical protein [Nisaea nitritireducens]
MSGWGGFVKGFLLNVLREVGNSVRYGDAKCVVIAGVSFTLLMSYFRFLWDAPGKTWGIMASIDVSGLDGKDTLIIALLFSSFVLSALALIPSTSRKSYRISFLNWVNKKLYQSEAISKSNGIVYFRDIAMYETLEEYGVSLESKFESGKGLDQVECDLSAQVWVVSRIATAKFIVANFSVYFLFSAVALFFVMSVF